MKRLNFIFLSLFYLTCTYSQIYSMDKFEMYAIDHLRGRMSDTAFWNKVHSIEFMIDLGENKLVEILLENQLRKYESEPQKRIGYWRCMAMNESDIQTKNIYVKKILDVYLNSNNSDVIHAAESLAKLSYSLTLPPVSKLSDKEQNNILEAYVNWSSIYPKTIESSINYDRLFELLNSNNNEYRRIMAYGTKYLGKIDSSNWNRLVDLALKESSELLTEVYLLCGAYITCPETERNNPNIEFIGEKLKQIAKSDNLKNRYEAFIAIGRFANPNDIDFIKQEMLKLASNITNDLIDEKTLDVMSAISYAFLKTSNYKVN